MALAYFLIIEKHETKKQRVVLRRRWRPRPQNNALRKYLLRKSIRFDLCTLYVHKLVAFHRKQITYQNVNVKVQVQTYLNLNVNAYNRLVFPGSWQIPISTRRLSGVVVTLMTSLRHRIKVDCLLGCGISHKKYEISKRSRKILGTFVLEFRRKMWRVNFSCATLHIPVSTRRHFNVDLTLFRRQWRLIDVETTSYAYWDIC